MIVQIDDNFRITTDPHNFMIEEKGDKKPTEKHPNYPWERIGYYSTFEGVLFGLINHKLRQSVAQDVVGLKLDVKELKAMIEAIFDVKVLSTPCQLKGEE